MSSEAPRSATLHDVAAAAGVDPSVVSRIVNADPSLRVRRATYERVMAAIQQVGYLPNASARSLRTAEARAIGLLIPDYANPVYGEIIRGAERAALEAGRVLLTGSVGREGYGVDDFLRLLGRGRVDRLLIAGVYLSSSTVALLEQSRTPWLLMNSQQPEAPWTVSLDDARAAAIAVDHLRGLGHRQIAHLRGPVMSDTARRREEGYRTALSRHGLHCDPALVVQGGYTAADGRQAMQDLLESGAAFSAVLAGNLASALGAIHEARRRQLDVPADVSIVGIHDLALADYVLPALTTVRTPLHELGRRGVELLLSDDESRANEVIREPLELVWRSSSGPARRLRQQDRQSDLASIQGETQ